MHTLTKTGLLVENRGTDDVPFGFIYDAEGTKRVGFTSSQPGSENPATRVTYDVPTIVLWFSRGWASVRIRLAEEAVHEVFPSYQVKFG